MSKKSIIFTVIGSLLAIAAMVMIIWTLREHKSARNVYNDANNRYVSASADTSVSPETTQPETKPDTQTQTPEEVINLEWYELADVDVKTLCAEHPDAIGWIFFENESISYPIMYAAHDNDKYLHTTLAGTYNSAGSIFMDGESTPDFTDPHTLIYGHNLRNLTMFGRLRYYRNTKGYYDTHQYFQIHTPDQILRYQIFAFERVSANSDVYEVYGPDPEGRDALINEITSHSMVKTDIPIYDDDHIITLSTCISDELYRFVVCGVLIDEYDK